MREHQKLGLLQKEAGLAFLWILFLLAIMSALSLAFLQKVSIGRSATATRGSAMQTHYLARSAANHALWRLLNDPDFSAPENVYSMHALDNGRYGYKVRRPTLTTFGTVATVGALEDVVTKESYVQYLKPYDIITAYEPDGGFDIPEFRQLLGATWIDRADTLNVGPNDSKYVVTEGCPTRKEVIMGTLDSANDINFAVWDGSTWGNLSEFTQGTGSYQYQCFDVAYESQSGDALVVGRYDNAGSVRYNVWDGDAWAFGTPQEDPALQAGGINPSYIDMASSPLNDEILIAEVDQDMDLKVVQWNGSSFNDLGEIDTDMAFEGYGSAEVVYEQQSGDALVLWNHKNSSQIYFSVWSGASLSPVDQIPFDLGGVPYVIRAAADPTSDHIVVAEADKFYDLNVAVWDGNAWIDSREIETYVFILKQPVFDIAWEQSGEDLVIAWAPWGPTNIRYFSWQKGTALADHAIKTGPDFQAYPHIVRLHPISDSQKIILLVDNIFNDLRYGLWTGNTFLGDPPILLESDLDSGLVVFDIAESGVTYTGGSG